MLQIRLFGKPQVICDGTDITPELGNKGCALLCILFLRGGDYYAREKLAAYLWPDSAASAAKYNLRYTLWKIKKSTDTGEGGRSLIKLDREYCCIDRAYDYICDLQTIDEIDPETRSADELKRACDAFGGELLDAIGYDVRPDDRTLLRVLGAIQPAAAVCAGAEGEVTAAPAAVAQAFIRWLTGLAARQPLAVHIRRAGEMDDVSRGVLEYLLAERPAGLTLLTEDGGAPGDMSSRK